MTDEPAIVADNVVLDNRQDRRFNQNWIRWSALLVLAVGILGWTLFKMDLRRERAQPNQPLTKADAGSPAEAPAGLTPAAPPDPATVL